jgi:hypothetical protein
MTSRYIKPSSWKPSRWKMAGAATALSLAALTLSAPAEAYSHNRRHARAHYRHSYARVYVPGPADVYYGDSGYSCGIGLYNTPLACEPNR